MNVTTAEYNAKAAISHLELISEKLDYAGAVRPSEDIWSAAQDLRECVSTLAKAYDELLTQGVKNAEANSHLLLASALAGIDAAKQ